ncbi:hypothetical protein E2562_010188 [Oryza meyeriana var. granulata]|uniref:Cytochrome P450 n=1 Tax=Oryza meyeriana var. granulata TaxID=110450 RepID=A0A6G1EIC4_9ORYZ|nr:hypothetical protein E2562_010188 [Oryza meyeriana var. granulata]
MGPLFSRDLLGDGIFGVDDEVWRCQRKCSLAGIDKFAYDVIRKRKEEVAAEQETAPSAGRRSGLLTVFTKMRDADTGAPYSNKFLHDICINFILAGHDTSSVALAWFFWLLSKNTRHRGQHPR